MADVSSEYWAYNDPRWANDPAYGNPEKMKYMGPWDQVLQSTGFKGRVFQPMYTEMADPNGGTMMLESGQQYTPEAKAAIDQLRSSGYDLRWKHPDRSTYNTYWGFVTPEGVKDIKFEGSDVGNIIKPLIKTWGAGLGLAGLGAGINSLLGGAGAGVAPANALAMDLAGGSADLAGALGGGQFAAAGGLPLTAADLASLPADVLGQISQAPAVEVANFPPLGDRTVTNVMAGGTGGAETAVLSPATTPSVDATNLLIPERAPLLPPSGQLTPLTPFPETSGIVPTPPTFTPSTLAVKPTAGIMEGMVPGGLSGATGYSAIAEAAATNSLLGGLNAGALGAGGIGGVEGAALADIAGGMVPQFGSIPAYSAGLGAGAGALGAGVLGAGGGGSAGAAPVATAPAAVTPATAATTAPAAATVAETALPVAAATGAGAAGGGTEALSALDQAALDMGAGATNVGAATGGGSILDQVMSFFRSPAGGAALSGLGSVIGGITQANAAQAAANQQAEAARNALALQREMFEYQKNLLAPYQKYGTAALERLSGALGLEGAAKPQQALEMDPGYGFRLGEGLKALERMQAARGSMLSGGAMKAGQRYAQDYASGEYGNAYNRLANIAGLGQTAGTQLGGAAQQFGQTAGNVMGQEANALAAGRIGRGSAYGNAIQGGLNAYSNYLNQQQQNQLFRDIFGRTAIGS